jgi:hypothetical protein
MCSQVETPAIHLLMEKGGVEVEQGHELCVVETCFIWSHVHMGVFGMAFIGGVQAFRK